VEYLQGLSPDGEKIFKKDGLDIYLRKIKSDGTWHVEFKELDFWERILIF